MFVSLDHDTQGNEFCALVPYGPNSNLLSDDCLFESLEDRQIRSIYHVHLLASLNELPKKL